MEQALSQDEDAKALGLATLEVLAHSELARKEELELFDIAWGRPTPAQTKALAKEDL